MSSSSDNRVAMICPTCPAGKGDAGELAFPDNFSGPIEWTCRRGHVFHLRRLTREERRARGIGDVVSPWVAAPFEHEQQTPAGKLQVIEGGKT